MILKIHCSLLGESTQSKNYKTTKYMVHGAGYSIRTYVRYFKVSQEKNKTHIFFWGGGRTCTDTVNRKYTEIVPTPQNFLTTIAF
jgi:hypothetical protein